MLYFWFYSWIKFEVRLFNYASTEYPPSFLQSWTKSLGTNLHLWRFFKRAKQTVTREFIYTWSAPPPPSPPPTMLDTCTRYFSRVSTLYGGAGGGGEVTQFKTDNSAFLKLRFENTEN